MARNSLKGLEWLSLKGLLCFGHFWKLIKDGWEAS